MKTPSVQGGNNPFKEKNQKHQTRRCPATLADLLDTPLFKNAESLISKFVGVDEKRSKSGEPIHLSYICELKQNQKLELIQDGIEYLYIIVKGHLRLSLPSSFQHATLKEYFVAWRSAGQILGEMSPLAGETQSVILIASTDCEFVEIPSELFIKIADKNAILYRNLVELLIQKTFDERRRADLVQTLGKFEQVIYTLIELYEARGYEEDENGHQVINGLVRERDIAAFLGCTRQNVTKHIQKLEIAKIIEGNKVGRNDAKIKILNIEKLRQLAPKFI